MKMMLFDVSVEPGENRVELWFKSGDRVFRETERFKPKLYIKTSGGGVPRVLERYDVDSCFVMKKRWPGRDEERFLEVTVYNPGRLNQVAEDVYREGGFRENRVYNADLSLPFRYLLRNGLYPTIDIESDEGQYDLDYEVEDLKTIEIDLDLDESHLNSSVPIEKIYVGENEVTGGEKEVLEGLKREVSRVDPDIIYTRPGVMEHIVGMADGTLDLGRLPGSREITSKTHSSYGRTIHKPGSLVMRGRIHINKNSFIYSESGLDGVLELSRLSSRPIHEVARTSPGTVISSMQMALAQKEGILIPWKKTVPEDFKTAGELIKADRGGLTLQPRVGFHQNVTEVDYSSLFPNIISRKNISPETINCSCCNSQRVPQLGYSVCNEKGFLPRVVEPLIRRREKLKKRIKNEGDIRDRRRVVALKWVLVTCFGYTGYKNAKYGKIECHESICAYGRDIMAKTIQIAEESGYKVIHGVVDSLWLAGDGDLIGFKEKVEKRVDIPLDIEASYRWMVFLPRRRSRTGALNRYYGVKENGELKVRGIELRRRDTPKIIKEFQKEALNALKDAENKSEFIEKQSEVTRILKRYKKQIKNGEVAREKLAYETKPSKKPCDYKTMNRNKAALIKHREHGYSKKPGQKIKYVIRNSNSKTRDKVGLVDQETPIDKTHYIDMLDRAYKSLQFQKGCRPSKQKEIQVA